MANFIDLTGKRFGRLTVLSCAGKSSWGNVKWLCKCDCGNTRVVLAGNLRSGKQLSCGCLRKEHFNHTIHGESKNCRLYRIWTGIKTRCLNKNCKAFPNYGGRGIKVCNEWMDYVPFRNWALANGYSDTLSIDRIDNDKGYFPHNCRWTSKRQQANNRRSSRMIEIDGKTMTTAEAARTEGIDYHSFMKRLYREVR